MYSTTGLLVLVITLVAGEEGNVVERLSFCAGTEVTMRCPGNREIISLNVSVYASSLDSNQCKSSEDFTTRKDLCCDEYNSADKEGLGQSIYRLCLHKKECLLTLPSDINFLIQCGGKSKLFGIQVDLLCSVESGIARKIYRRQVSSSNSRERHNNPRDTSFNRQDTSFNRRDTSFNRQDKNRQSDFNSGQVGQRSQRKSTELKSFNSARNLYKSRETGSNYNSMERKNSKGTSQNNDDSYEYARGGRRKNGGGNSQSRRNGGYSAAGSQTGYNSAGISSVVSSILVACLAATLLL